MSTRQKLLLSAVFVIFAVTGCLSANSPIAKEIKKELAIANKNLGFDEVKTIKLENTLEEGDLIILTPPYVGKEALSKVINDEQLLKILVKETNYQECMHLYIINGNKIKTHETLGGVDIDGVLYSKNKNIILKLKKLNRYHSPLIIEEIK